MTVQTVQVEIRKFPDFPSLFFNMRYMAWYKNCYASSNSEEKAIKKVLKKANAGFPKPYYVEVSVEAV